MRSGWREILLGLTVATLATGMPAYVRAGPLASGSPVRLTVEIEWNSRGLPTLPDGEAPEPSSVDLELTEGRVVDVVAWPEPSATGPEPHPGGASWSLGHQPQGRVRARIEAPVSASLLIRAGGRVTGVPITALLEAPQHSLAPSPVEVQVRRLEWDALEVALEGGGDGTVAPDANVPLLVGFNVLTPEGGEAVVRIDAALRPAGGGEVLQRWGGSHVVATNTPRAPTTRLEMRAPSEEGTYVLEIQASWQPAEAQESSRLAWILRRRRKTWPGPAVASRRISFAVVRPDARVDDGDVSRPSPSTPGHVVDSVDLVRGRGTRPALSGRTGTVAPGSTDWALPPEALVEPQLRDRLRGWLFRGSEAATLGAAEPAGLAWSALALHVPNPGRLHRLNLTVEAGDPSDLGVALVSPGSGSGSSRVFLDARASGLVVAEGGEPTLCSWPIWPDAAEPVLVLVNRGSSGPIRVGSIALEELNGDLPPARLADTHPEQPRTVGLVLSGTQALDRFGGGSQVGPFDTVAFARNLASYLEHCGASLAVLPGALADRTRRGTLEGQAAEDPIGPDRLEVTLGILARYGLTAWIDLRLDGPLPGLPPVDSPAALSRGLVRIDDRGRPDRPLAYFPLHPDVQAAMRQAVTDALAPKPRHANLAGLLVRLGPGATLPGGPETGLDDSTYARFVASVFDPAQARQVPGQDTTQPDRYAARRTYVTGPGSRPWLTWRARELARLYRDLAGATSSTAPGVTLAVATPTIDGGPAGQAARAADLAGLPPLQAWESVGFDLEHWPSQGGPIVLRGVVPADDPLGQELASHPDLDAPVASRPDRGMLLASEPSVESDPHATNARLVLAADPVGTSPGDVEAGLPLGHSLAVLDARWLLFGATSIAGREAALARFARVARALPAPVEVREPLLSARSGIAARSWTVGGKTYLGLANDTPYTLWLNAVVRSTPETPVDDLGRDLRLQYEPAKGGRQIVVELPPFGVAALRIGAAPATVASIATTPPRGDDTFRNQYRAIAARLERLGQLAGDGTHRAPPNPGFEPPDEVADSEGETAAAGSETPVVGWSTPDGDPSRVMIDLVAPRSGIGSLRFDAETAPSAVISDAFTPPGGRELIVRAWLRAEPPNAKVRVWVEGQSGDQSVRLVAPLEVPADWAERKIRAATLPEGGLQWARLRFELMDPGQLWIDDLSVHGEQLSEPDRRAMRDLMTAQVAYREGRWADFARLVGSRWVRMADLGSPSPSLATSPEGESARSGGATGLPADSRLR